MITIKPKQLDTRAWQMTLVDGDGFYVGTVISPFEDVAREMARSAAMAAERMNTRQPQSAEAACDA